MPYVSVAEDSWTTVVTTTADTVFVNSGSQQMFVTSVSTGGLSVREGFPLAPNSFIVYGAGHAVKASSAKAVSSIFYEIIGEV